MRLKKVVVSMLVFYLLIVEVTITKSWMIPVSGQDSDKLVEKFVKKGPMKTSIRLTER
jgi:hypothetical protein